MVAHAKKQLQEWCISFAESVAASAVLINFHYGDATVFCHELVSRNKAIPGPHISARLYTTQWFGVPLALDGPGAGDLPTAFDVIDTSNLADWTGHLNMLLAARSLLAEKMTSVLYTETFRLCSREPHNELPKALSMSVALAGLLIGLAPNGHQLGFATENNAGEDFTHLENINNRYRMRISWRLVVDARSRSDPKGSKAHFEAKELAAIFFDIYLKMFSNESPEGFRLELQESETGRLVTNRNTRWIYAALIQLAMQNITTDWSEFQDELFAHLSNYQSPMVSLRDIGDLQRQLLLNGAASIMLQEPVMPSPSVSFVTLVVPHNCLKPIRHVAPKLHVGFIKKGRIRWFYSFDCFFGTVKQNADGSWAEITNDPAGWLGKSDMIVTLALPTEYLDNPIMTMPHATPVMPMDDKDLEFALFLTTAWNTFPLTKTMNSELKVFGTSLNDKNHLYISQLPPGISKERLESYDDRDLTKLEPEELRAITMNILNGAGNIKLQAKYTMVAGSRAAVALGKSAIVAVMDPKPSSLTLQIGDSHAQRIHFPCLVSAKNYKVRISRENLWIEVTVPIASGLTTGGYDSESFPTIVSKNHQPFSWAFARLDLSKQPKVRTTTSRPWLRNTIDQVSSKWNKQVFGSFPPSKDLRTSRLYVNRFIQNMIICAVEDAPAVFMFLNTDIQSYDTMAIALGYSLPNWFPITNDEDNIELDSDGTKITVAPYACLLESKRRRLAGELLHGKLEP